MFAIMAVMAAACGVLTSCVDADEDDIIGYWSVTEPAIDGGGVYYHFANDGNLRVVGFINDAALGFNSEKFTGRWTEDDNVLHINIADEYIDAKITSLNKTT